MTASSNSLHTQCRIWYMQWKLTGVMMEVQFMNDATDNMLRLWRKLGFEPVLIPRDDVCSLPRSVVTISIFWRSACASALNWFSPRAKACPCELKSSTFVKLALKLDAACEACHIEAWSQGSSVVQQQSEVVECQGVQRENLATRVSPQLT